MEFLCLSAVIKPRPLSLIGLSSEGLSRILLHSEQLKNPGRTFERSDKDNSVFEVMFGNVILSSLNASVVVGQADSP